MAYLDYFDERPTWNNMRTPRIMQRMENLYETSQWHDCVFKLWKSDGTGEELVFAHNIILASSSPVFEALCFGPLSEEKPIEVPDIDPLAFRTMLKFIYTDRTEFSSVEVACNVLYAAKKYLLYTLAGLAISYISYHINESNCLQVYNFASFIQEDGLVKESWSYLCSHFDNMLKYFSYESLSTDLIKKLVKEEALNGSEIILYKICLMWAEAECENNNLEKNCENFRKVLIQADVLNKIRWLTLTSEEFEEGPKKSGILTSDEIKFISKIINLLESEVKPKLRNLNESDDKTLENMLLESNCFPFSVNNNVEIRKKIELKKFYCYRSVEREIRPALGLPNDLKIRTYITVNKSVRLTAVILNAKLLPFPELNTAFAHSCSIQRDYNEKLFISVCDNNDKELYSSKFLEKVNYGTVFKIPLKTPVILEKSKEYKIQIDLLNSSENYILGVRNSISKFPSGLCVTFREQANVRENGRFVEANDLGIILGLEIYL